MLKAGGPSGPYRGEVPHLATDRPGRGGPDLSPTPVYYLRLRRRLSRNSSLLSTRHSRDNHVPNGAFGAPLQQRHCDAGTASQKGEANPTEIQAQTERGFFETLTPACSKTLREHWGSFETFTHAAYKGHETGTLMPTTPNLIRFMNLQHGATITTICVTHEHAAHRAHDSAPLNPATPADRPRDSYAYRRRTAEGASARATQRVQSVTCVPVEHTTEGVLLKTQRRTGPGMVPRGGRTNRLELTSITPHAYWLIGDVQPNVLRHARRAPARDVLRHCDRRRTAEGAPAREAVLRHCDRRRTAEGAPAREAVLRHCDRRRTAEGAPAREAVLRHCDRRRTAEGAPAREAVLRHCDRRRTAEGAPAREAVLRHCDRRRTAEGAPAREAVLRHCDRRRTAEGAPALRPATYSRRCSGTAIGDEQPKVLRHARCSGTTIGDVQPKVLRHYDRRRTAEGAPALRSATNSRRCSGTRGASAQERRRAT